jgi:hypothetical protein
MNNMYNTDLQVLSQFENSGILFVYNYLLNWWRGNRRPAANQCSLFEKRLYLLKDSVFHSRIHLRLVHTGPLEHEIMSSQDADV